MKQDFDEKIVHLIDMDEIKKCLPGYTPEKADEFHSESAKIADALLDENLKILKNKQERIVFMSGGSASGKTEFIATFYDGIGIVFDSTFSNKKGAEIKIKKVLKSGNIPVVYLVLPADFKKSFSAFHNRERKIPEYRFYETHSGSRETCFWIAKNFPEIEMRVYRNLMEFENEKNPLPFEEIIFDSQQEIIEFLDKNCYSEEEIFDFIDTI